MNETTTALAEVKKATVPPPTKRQLIAATAKAIRDEQIASRQAASKENDRLYELAKQATLKLARKRIASKDFKPSALRMDSTYRNGERVPIVEMLFDLDYKSLPEWQAYNMHTVPSVHDESDIRKQLESASRNQPLPLSRDEILNLPGMREKLLEIGKKALGIAEAKSGNAIEA